MLKFNLKNLKRPLDVYSKGRLSLIWGANFGTLFLFKGEKTKNTLVFLNIMRFLSGSMESSVNVVVDIHTVMILKIL